MTSSGRPSRKPLNRRNAVSCRASPRPSLALAAWVSRAAMGCVGTGSRLPRYGHGNPDAPDCLRWAWQTQGCFRVACASTPTWSRRSWPAWPAPPLASPPAHAARKRNSPAADQGGLGVGGVGASVASRRPADAVFLADAPGAVHHGQVVLHRHVIRNRVSRPEGVAASVVAETPALLISRAADVVG